MLDRRFIREHRDEVVAAARVKGVDVDIDRILRLDDTARDLLAQVEALNHHKRVISQGFRDATSEEREQRREESRQVDARLSELRESLEVARAELDGLLLLVPNIPWDGAPVGDESANAVVRRWGSPRQVDFELLSHVELVERRRWVEFERARRVAGERAYALRGDLVRLERAIHSYAIDLLVDREFVPLAVPALVREGPLVGTGMFPKGRADTYELPDDDLFLAGTSEVALVGLHSGEILDVDELPVRYAGISPCFRREAGRAGRDVRGLLRVHQFEKVEQFVICRADEAESAAWHADLLGVAETILQAFELPYEVVECATGDMGLGKFRMNDVNTWFPSLGTFRETHSCSTLHDWQARRAGLRYREADGTIRFAHTLNNTAVATPRLLAALIENRQEADLTVSVPAVLQPYLGGATHL